MTLHELEAELAELREAVRDYLDHSFSEVNTPQENRLRQLIEEKP